ncbi:hypothetical protein [Kitasatospora kazusensis]|uniref:hypothetical protein n=1 Tax=Kitasatospora kazusensis TaxID=407974 RepID=UPI0031D93ADF
MPSPRSHHLALPDGVPHGRVAPVGHATAVRSGLSAVRVPEAFPGTSFGDPLNTGGVRGGVR